MRWFLIPFGEEEHLPFWRAVQSLPSVVRYSCTHGTGEWGGDSWRVVGLTDEQLAAMPLPPAHAEVQAGDVLGADPAAESDTPPTDAQRLERAERSLRAMGATDNGGELWKPPVNERAAEAWQRMLAAEAKLSPGCPMAPPCDQCAATESDTAPRTHVSLGQPPSDDDLVALADALGDAAQRMYNLLWARGCKR